jgi:membrane protein YdbS with pleckstrin-like domain
LIENRKTELYNCSTSEVNNTDNIVLSQSGKALLVEFVKIFLPIFLIFIVFTVLSTKILTTIVSGPSLIIIGLLLFAIAIPLSYFLYLATRKNWESKKYIVDAKNIHIINGIFQSAHVLHGLSGVVSVSINQSPLERAFSYGTITLTFFGGRNVNIENIEQPEEIMEKIQIYIEKAKG